MDVAEAGVDAGVDEELEDDADRAEDGEGEADGPGCHTKSAIEDEGKVAFNRASGRGEKEGEKVAEGPHVKVKDCLCKERRDDIVRPNRAE